MTSQGFTNANGEVCPPPGSIMMYMGITGITSSLPIGWLYCNGS